MEVLILHVLKSSMYDTKMVVGLLSFAYRRGKGEDWEGKKEIIEDGWFQNLLGMERKRLSPCFIFLH